MGSKEHFDRRDGSCRRVRIAAAALVLAWIVLMTASCAGGTETSGTGDGGDEPATTEQATTQSGTELDLATWFEGAWEVGFELTSVTPDASWSRMAADQPEATWDAVRDGSEMLIDAGNHVYRGTLEGTDDAWTYTGSATYVDEDGTEWTSSIVVTGRRTSEGSFEAEQWGQISSEGDGVLYEATWDAVGQRAAG